MKKINGLYESWYSNGQIQERCNYNNGQISGGREIWYENGSLMIQEEQEIKNKAIANKILSQQREIEDLNNSIMFRKVDFDTNQNIDISKEESSILNKYFDIKDSEFQNKKIGYKL